MNPVLVKLLLLPQYLPILRLTESRTAKTGFKHYRLQLPRAAYPVKLRKASDLCEARTRINAIPRNQCKPSCNPDTALGLVDLFLNPKP